MKKFLVAMAPASVPAFKLQQAEKLIGGLSDMMKKSESTIIIHLLLLLHLASAKLAVCVAADVGVSPVTQVVTLGKSHCAMPHECPLTDFFCRSIFCNEVPSAH